MVNPITQTLGITDSDEEQQNSLPVVYNTTSEERVSFTDAEQLQVDADYGRDGLYDALAKSQQLVSDLTTYTLQTQTPKSYETLNTAIKTMAEISMSLVELNQRKVKVAKDIQSVDAANKADPLSPTNITNNNLFVGSTAEFQDFLDNLRR